MENLIEPQDLKLFIDKNCAKLQCLKNGTSSGLRNSFHLNSYPNMKILFHDNTQITIYLAKAMNGNGSVVLFDKRKLTSYIWASQRQAKNKQDLLEMIKKVFDIKKLAINKQKIIINATARCFR